MVAGGLKALDASKLLLDDERVIIENAFNLLDRDKSGRIEKREFEGAVMKLGLLMEEEEELFPDIEKEEEEEGHAVAQLQKSKHRLSFVLQNVGTDDSGQLTKAEFFDILLNAVLESGTGKKNHLKFEAIA
jgi:Ca2+-binding EF-hand superfamily protein